MLKSPHSQRTEKEPRAQHELPARSPLRPPRPTRPVTQDVILDEWSPEWKPTIPAPAKPAVTHPHPHRPLRHPPQLPKRRSRIETSQNGTASNSSTATPNGSASSKTSTSTPKPTSRSSRQSKKASSNATSHSSRSPS